MKIPIIFAIATFCFGAQVSATPSERDLGEIAIAEQAIFWSQVLAASAEGRQTCLENPLVCPPNVEELGLMVLSNKRSAQARNHYVSLLRYRLDAGIAEDYTCEMLNKGPKVYSTLKHVDAAYLATKCEREVAQAKNVYKGQLDGISPALICTKPEKIKSRAIDLLLAIRQRRKCDSHDN